MEFLKDFSAVFASLILGVIGFLLSIYHHKNSVKLAKQQRGSIIYYYPSKEVIVNNLLSNKEYSKL